MKPCPVQARNLPEQLKRTPSTTPYAIPWISEMPIHGSPTYFKAGSNTREPMLNIVEASAGNAEPVARV